MDVFNSLSYFNCLQHFEKIEQMLFSLLLLLFFPLALVLSFQDDDDDDDDDNGDGDDDDESMLVSIHSKFLFWILFL